MDNEFYKNTCLLLITPAKPQRANALQLARRGLATRYGQFDETI